MPAKKIRQHNAAGELVAAGYEWREPMVFSGGAGAAKALVSLMVCFVGLTSPDMGVLAVIPMTGIFLAWVFSLDGFPRRVTFHRDGKITARFTFGEELLDFSLDWPHTDIASIETSKGYIWLYSREGDLARVGRGNIEYKVAHKAAVQLTMALTELRAACANSVRQTRPESAPDHRDLPVIP